MRYYPTQFFIGDPRVIYVTIFENPVQGHADHPDEGRANEYIFSNFLERVAHDHLLGIEVRFGVVAPPVVTDGAGVSAELPTGALPSPWRVIRKVLVTPVDTDAPVAAPRVTLPL